MASSDDFTMSGDGYRVTRNGVTIVKPVGMSDDHWFKYVAPRVGTYCVKGSDYLFGQDEETLLEGTEEMEDGCSGGACAI